MYLIFVKLMEVLHELFIEIVLTTDFITIPEYNKRKVAIPSLVLLRIFIKALYSSILKIYTIISLVVTPFRFRRYKYISCRV
jgi:hypothetical protein